MQPATKQTIDEANFHLALLKLRERFPDGVEAVFQTSDQGLHGFWLRDVLDSDAESLLEAMPADERHQLESQLSGYLADLDWDGVMAEDAFGRAEVLISAGATHA